MRLRWKKSCLAVGCLSVVILSAVIIVKTQKTGGSLPVWNGTGGRDEAEDMAGRQEQNVNGTNSREQDVDGADGMEQNVDSADSREQDVDGADGWEQNVDSANGWEQDVTGTDGWEQNVDSANGWEQNVGGTDGWEQNVNGMNGLEQDAGGMDTQEQSKDSAGGQDENTETGRGETNIKRVALTFDDGPHPRYTKQLLEGLRERNVHVTFFVLGQSAELYPDLILEMAQDGHLIGNHTYSHIQLTSRNGQRFAEELQKTDAVIYEITGQHTEFVRPPYGVWDKRYEESLNMIQVLWNVDPLDWCCSDAGIVTSRVIGKADEDCIILLHDVYESSVAAALTIIDELSAQGYEFVTVDEIILD